MELILVLWSKKIFICIFTLGFAVISIFYSLNQPNEYRAFAVLSSTQDQSTSVTGLGSKLSTSLSSLPGIDLRSPVTTNESIIALEIMQSWGFIEGFINNNSLDVSLAATSWKEETNELIINPNIFNQQESKWVKKPTSWILYKKFSKRLSISKNSTTGLITISMEYFSPVIVKQWIELYINSINNHMRERKLKQTETNLAYLQAQLQKTSNKEMKDIFYRLIQEQIKTQMLAEATPEYAFTTISQPMVPEEKSKPKRSIMVMLGTLLGGILSVLLTLVLYFTRLLQERT